MGGRYKAYPEYKDSGVEWLGEIPTDWTCKRLKYGVELYSQKVLSESAERYVGMENIASGTGKFLVFDELSPDGISNRFCKGDVLFGKLRPYLAKSWLANFEGICSAEFLVLRSKAFSAKFLNYYTLTEEFVRQVDASTYGSKMPRANWEFIGSMMIPIPPMQSEKIATFLDHETTKIDTLIEKQQQLIQLLKEKRQAVISHAVTKGLNPNVKMRDSGIEWLGEVPEHWTVAKLSFRYEVLLGKMLDERRVTGEHLGKYLRNTDVQWDSINEEDLPEMDFLPVERNRYSVTKGDLIVCEGGEIGRSAIWEKEYPCFYQKALHRLRPLSEVSDHTRFMFYSIFDAVHQERFLSGAPKATIAHLPAETFRQYQFAFPPHEEQKAIAKYLDDRKYKFDVLHHEAKKQISLLQERRTALISAAVTGKIDVRDWVPPAPDHCEEAA